MLTPKKRTQAWKYGEAASWQVSLWTRSLIYSRWAGRTRASETHSQTDLQTEWTELKSMQDLRKRSGKRCIDVCNCDADGLCSILQWRLHEPKESTILALMDAEASLVGRVHTRPGDEFLMCDIPIEPNRSTLLQLLQAGARVQYFNHYVTDEIPYHPGLRATIDACKQTSTSLTVDRLLGGKFRKWAVVGAYGKRTTYAAESLALEMGIGSDTRARLRELGKLISYNACATHERNACIPPSQLYERLSQYRDPLEFLRSESLASELDAARRDDLAKASALAPFWQDENACVYVLPDTPWAHRVACGLDEELAANNPTRAHAFLCDDGKGGFSAKVRVARSEWPREPSSHGPAAGCERPRLWVIDHLPAGELNHFIQAFSASRWGRLRSPVFRAAR